MKILDFFLILWVIFAQIRTRIRNLNADPDPATQINADPCGTDPDTDPDPKPCFLLNHFFHFALYFDYLQYEK